MNQPIPQITFTPLYMERVWGGRELESIYGRSLPKPDIPYGESWELVDRENEQSVVNSGPYAGKTLHELWNHHREEIFGPGYENLGNRFPILLKILDARRDLSIQVHPPADKAEELGGEPKTEMWYIADCEKNAKLYVGFRKGLTPDSFRSALEDGTVADCVHPIEPKAGDSIFIPSGRLHAIGGGFLIHEIQQNSDTTYRVFDWNRTGLDGKPRELHVEKSLASVDFADFEPSMEVPDGKTLASCPHFRTERVCLHASERYLAQRSDRFVIISIIDGVLECIDGRRFQKGETILLSADGGDILAKKPTSILEISMPAQGV